jgi:hypothetical protein
MGPPTANPADTASRHIAIRAIALANPANERAGEQQEVRSDA